MLLLNQLKEKEVMHFHFSKYTSSEFLFSVLTLDDILGLTLPLARAYKRVHECTESHKVGNVTKGTLQDQQDNSIGNFKNQDIWRGKQKKAELRIGW